MLEYAFPWHTGRPGWFQDLTTHVQGLHKKTGSPLPISPAPVQLNSLLLLVRACHWSNHSSLELVPLPLGCAIIHPPLGSLVAVSWNFLAESVHFYCSFLKLMSSTWDSSLAWPPISPFSVGKVMCISSSWGFSSWGNHGFLILSLAVSTPLHPGVHNSNFYNVYRTKRILHLQLMSLYSSASHTEKLVYEGFFKRTICIIKKANFLGLSW